MACLWTGVIDLNNYSGSFSVVCAADGEMGVSSSLASGDFDNDGYDDIVLGVPKLFPFVNSDGKAYVIFGSASFPDTLDLGNAGAGVTIILGLTGENTY